METFPVGLARIVLRVRHARSLKDRRQVVQGLVQRLRNLGCSVVDLSGDAPGFATLGIAYAGRDTRSLGQVISEIDRLTRGEFERVSLEKQSLDFEPRDLSVEDFERHPSEEDS